MKRFILALPVAISFLALHSCGGSKAGEHDQPVANAYFDSMHKADSLARYGPATAVDWKMAADKAYDRKRVTIEGYVALPSTSYSSGGSAQIELHEREAQYSGGRHFIVRVKMGDGNNTMKELKEGYLPADLQVKDKNGKTIGFNERVRITGELSVSDSYTSIQCQEIEKLDPVKLDYSTLGATEITAANVEDKTLEDQLVVAEGMLEIPVFLMLGGEDVYLNLAVKGIDKTVPVDIAYGTTPGRIEDIPKNYKPSDFKIHAPDGSIIDLGKKVRIYGTAGYGGRIKLESIENI